MDYQFIKCEKKEHLFYVTINRPEVMNALHPPAHQELNAIFDEFQEDPDLWIAVLTGVGEKAFCVGDDLKYRAQAGSQGVSMPKSGFGGITRRFDCFKPIIAAVNGFALGGGFETALACDIILAAEHAVFGLPEPRVGMMPATGVHRLPRCIPYHQAMGLILTGKRISAAEAFSLGIVNEVVTSGELLERAGGWANQILECSPLAIRACKQAVSLGLSRGLEEALGTSYTMERMMKESEDYIEGPKAFSEKRRPIWKGR